MFVISKTDLSVKVSQSNAVLPTQCPHTVSPLSVPSQCPPQFSAAWTIADALSQLWLKVLWSHTDPPSRGPILEEQGLPVPHHLLCQLGQEGAVLLLSLCPGVIISAFWTESKTKLRQSQLQLK